MGKSTLSVYLEDDVIAWIREQAKKTKLSESRYVALILEQGADLCRYDVIDFHRLFDALKKAQKEAESERT